MILVFRFLNDKSCAKVFFLPKWQFYLHMSFFFCTFAAVFAADAFGQADIQSFMNDLGLIYGIELKDDGVCEITMTLTAPSCPAGDFIVEDIRQKVGSVEGVKDVNVTIVFEPEWTKDMMSEEAKLELGFL